MSEENSLDDFFASKDKSKKSTKSSFTPDDIEQLMEKKLHKSKKSLKTKRKECPEETSQTLKVKTAEDDADWKEYEEVVKDYSGLKIQSLAPGTKNGVDQDSTGNQSCDDESGEKKDAPQGPWKPVAAPLSIPDPEPEPAPVVVAEPPKTGKYVPPAARQTSHGQAVQSTSEKPSSGKYIPPNMRQSQSSWSSASKLGIRSKKIAPDVSNVEDFPSLSAATIIEQGKLGQDFEKVKGGAKQVPQNTASKISLNNKFGALEDGDS